MNRNNNISKFFFTIFIFFLPWQTRFIFTPEKTEFLSFSIYLAEIFLWLALASWLTSTDLKKIRIPRVLMFFCFYIFLSIAWSPDKVAAFRLWLFVFDGIMVYLFLREHNEIRHSVKKVFLFSLFIAAVFGIWQFFNLGSPAWKWLGLATRGSWNLGDIVIAIGGERWLRAYGPLSHPNIFGGYLVMGILILFSLLSSRPKRSEAERSHVVDNSVRFLNSATASLGMTVGKYILSGVFLFALFLTFSRSAWLALVISAPFLPLVIKGEARRGIFKFILFLSALAIALSIIFWPFIRTRAESSGRLEVKSNTERVASWRDGLMAWKQNPFFGSGIGNNIFIKTSPLIIAGSYFDRYAAWINETTQPEPAHNIFILVLSQLGLAGFLIYLFVWKNFWKNPVIRPFLILFFIIGMLDHYLWTLWPGQILFWTTLAFFSNVDGGGQDGSARN